MGEKKSTTTEDRRHEVRPEHKIFTDAMQAWTDEAPEGEKRSAIVIQVSAKEGVLSTSSHISGNGQHIRRAAQVCMSTLNPDNPVGSILRQAAIDSLIEIGTLEPREEALQQESPEIETHNNDENE